MDHLRATIHTLSDEEIREFGSFVNRLRKKGKRKDLQLFRILREEEEYKPSQVIHKLYKEDNKEAYHALRKRLLRHLGDFIVLKNAEDDPSTQATAMGHLSLSRFLFDRQSPETAWRYLNKAEEAAAEHEHHDLLNAIYNLMIEQSASREPALLDELINKHNRNKILADEDERANIANSIVSRELARSRKEGHDIDLVNIVDDTLKEYQLHLAVMDRPRLLHNLVSMMRSAVLPTKDFYIFEPFVIGQYERMIEQGDLEESDLPYKASMLYMVAHALYRNKKFTEARHYLELLRADIQTDRRVYNRFFPRHAQLEAAVDMYEGRLNPAINTLRDLLADKKLNLSHEDRLNALVNIGIYQFHATDYRGAHDTLLEIYHTDRWCEEVMGKEWVMKKAMMEVLLYTELDHADMAESRIRSIERNYRDLFAHPLYARAATFLRLIKQVVLHPETASSKDFTEKVESSFDWIPTEQEDLQAIGFFAWLKSRMTGRNYQEVLLDLVG